jgi:pyruvate dehydrogenase E2 component (dihydrolipoamide acetyltransferase)/2-oxoglutarate dehydrogenase E2 component (dihydrolipoamide succinyltransferase)
MGADKVPVLTITTRRKGLRITLDCGADQLDAQAAIQLLTDFAGRVEQPLRHLL